MENQNDMPIIDMDGFAGLLRHESLNIIIAGEVSCRRWNNL